MATYATLRQGSTGTEVQVLQSALKTAGYLLKVDGIFGPLTLAAVEGFQSTHGLKVDGVVGPHTWRALKIQVGGPTMEVDRVRTPTTPAAVAGELAQQLPGASREQAALLLAQLMLEIASGAACYNWNVGNITSNESGSFYRPLWWTIGPDSSPRLRQLHEAMLKGAAPRAFRAYSSLSAGVADYLAELRRDFPSLLAASESGDAAAFAAAIKSSRYAPDAQPGTDKSIRSLQDTYLRQGLFSSLHPLAETEPADLPQVRS